MYLLSSSAVTKAHVILQKSKAEPESSKKRSQKELEIAKAKATAAAQSETDEVVLELKMLHPVCSEHRTYCWRGHSSGEHVALTEMRFRSWAIDYVSYMKNSLRFSLSIIVS
jgi:hypothetical protein